jgi:hypothetical protein
MEAFYDAHRADADPPASWVEAASRVAAMYRAANDPTAGAWCKKTVAAYERLRARSAPGDAALPTAERLASECADVEPARKRPLPSAPNTAHRGLLLAPMPEPPPPTPFALH